MQNEPRRQIDISIASIWSGALLTISLILLQGFFSLTTIDDPIYYSIYTFSLAIPILSYKILVDLLRRRKYNPANISPYQATKLLSTPNWELVIFLIGVIAAIVGIVLALWHFQRIAGIIFIMSTVIVGLLYINQSMILSKKQRDGK